MKQSMPQPDDPLYMTIRTVKMSKDDDEIQVAPEPPPPRQEQHVDFDQLSRAEQYV